jgi:phage/plasmid-like protein (TIGR03299 family)
MSADIETMFSGGNEIPWHGQGTVIEQEVVKAAEAIQLAGLDWTVELVPLFAPVVASKRSDDGNPYSELPEAYKGVQRSLDGRILGITSHKYKPVQNHEAFSFMDALVDSGEAKYETAGALGTGSVVWMLARIPRDLKIGGMESELVNNYLLLSNSFDRSRALSICVTPVRVVCRNTLQMATRAASRTWSTRHRGDMAGKMIEARETLELTFSYLDEFEVMANDLLKTEVTNKQMQNLLAKLFPVAKDADLEKDRAARNKITTRDGVMALFSNADNLANVRNTGWAAYNAVAEYSDHHRRGNTTANADADENRFKRVISDYSLKDQALAILTK